MGGFYEFSIELVIRELCRRQNQYSIGSLFHYWREDMDPSVWICESTSYPRALWRMEWSMNGIQLFHHKDKRTWTMMGHVKWSPSERPTEEWGTYVQPIMMCPAIVWPPLECLTMVRQPIVYPATVHPLIACLATVQPPMRYPTIVTTWVHTVASRCTSIQAMIMDRPNDVILSMMTVLKYLQDLSMTWSPFSGWVM